MAVFRPCGRQRRSRQPPGDPDGQSPQELCRKSCCFTVTNINTQGFGSVSSFRARQSSHRRRPRQLWALTTRQPGLCSRWRRETLKSGAFGKLTPSQRLRIAIRVRTNPRYPKIGDPRIHAECFRQVIDFPGRHHVNTGFHHHHTEGLLNPLAPL